MQTTSKELYHFWHEFSKLIRTDTPQICRKFNKKTFEEILKESFYETPRMANGYIDFIDLANHINSKEIDFKNWIFMMIGEIVKTGKIRKKDFINPQFILKNIKLYTVNEINHQKELINNMLEDSVDDNPFTEFSDGKFDLYKVNEQQKNKLYELVKDGTLNYWFYLEGFDKKFKVDESKIVDQNYSKFLRLMQIVRHNNKEQ